MKKVINWPVSCWKINKWLSAKPTDECDLRSASAESDCRLVRLDVVRESGLAGATCGQLQLRAIAACLLLVAHLSRRAGSSDADKNDEKDKK